MSGSFRGFAVRCAAAAVLSAAWTAQSLAYDPPSGTVEYAINHSKYDEIGTHRVTFSRSGGDLVVDVRIDIKVKLLFITAHSLTSDRRETWRDGKLVAYTAHTDENSELIDVAARANGAQLVITGPAGKAEADGAVFPTHPWNPGIVTSKLLMDTKTGKLLKVSVAPAGEDVIKVAGKAIKTHQYTVSGDIARDLWFDAAGNWIQLRFVNDGATLTFTRTTPMP
ncbi:MAG: DUF6134 family protein [Alphaproteobacteria bacterium]|nr:DUF6134 family protein [Alphaproteobacteria bacterium]